jgi:hypothetical protein
MADQPRERSEPLSYASPPRQRKIDEREIRHLAVNCMQSGVLALACCPGLLCTGGIVGTSAELMAGLFAAAAFLMAVETLRLSGRVSTYVVLGLVFAGLAAALVVWRLWV